MKNNKKISKNNDNSYYINKSNKNEEIREDIIEGKNGVTEAIKHNRTIEQILVVKGINSVIPIINMAKEKGIVVHPAPGNYTGTLVNGILHHCSDLSGINGVIRPGIVHRIDKDTSGILVIAKNDEAHNDLAAQFKEHSIKREYYALVEGKFSKVSGTIDKPISRDKKERIKMAINSDGKRAVTHYEVLEQYNKGVSLVKCTLETGRTHQIRVHMASIGHPLVGDLVYGYKRQKFNIEGQALHAKTLGFIHPRTKEYMEFTSELPNYFKELLEKLRKM